MSLDLDERQRAMLQEMGLHVWLPQPEPVVLVLVPAPVAVAEPRQVAPAPPSAVPVAPASVPPPLANAIEKIAVDALTTGATAQKISRIPVAAPTTSVVTGPTGLADGIAAMDWPALAHTIANCQACPLSSGRRAPVFVGAEAPRQADWLVVGEPPDDAEERAGAPFADQAGQLLDNMLKAVGVNRHDAGRSGASAAYVSNVVKCRPATARNPDPQELATCANYLRREVALVQPKVILAMGRFAAQTLLRDDLPEVASIPLGKLRGKIYRYQGIPVVVTYHPTHLLRTPLGKARAWADLCLALQAMQPGQA